MLVDRASHETKKAYQPKPTKDDRNMGVVGKDEDEKEA